MGRGWLLPHLPQVAQGAWACDKLLPTGLQLPCPSAEWMFWEVASPPRGWGCNKGAPELLAGRAPEPLGRQESLGWTWAHRRWGSSWAWQAAAGVADRLVS